MYIKNRTSGFTLIELLVVMVIIGILALVVVAFLNSSRDKGVDAAIMNIASTAREQASLYWLDTGDYTDICTSDFSDTPKGVADFVAELNVLSVDVNCGENTTVTGWGLEAQLTDGTYFCVDATNIATNTVNASNITNVATLCDGA